MLNINGHEYREEKVFDVTSLPAWNDHSAKLVNIVPMSKNCIVFTLVFLLFSRNFGPFFLLPEVRFSLASKGWNRGKETKGSCLQSPIKCNCGFSLLLKLGNLFKESFHSKNKINQEMANALLCIIYLYSFKIILLKSFGICAAYSEIYQGSLQYLESNCSRRFRAFQKVLMAATIGIIGGRTICVDCIYTRALWNLETMRPGRLLNIYRWLANVFFM
ncbi:hypothetical protein AB205_0149520 [Aquarana catesbeiana]|uniref:Uncharacterized protein n=1 Tax=Aquarana catesbeiana TaxID=8400 RepID=A0A2G9RW99_AQUCT|nr:hypothetical protein AB205_0149520 [Aquarana catesbeiana]